MIEKLLPCKPEETMTEQIGHIASEVKELSLARIEYELHPTNKNRAEILFEALDVIAAVYTLLYMEFMDEDIVAGVNYVNSKNFVRGNLLHMGDYDDKGRDKNA